jgi:hypothetical protein
MVDEISEGGEEKLKLMKEIVARGNIDFFQKENTGNNRWVGLDLL